MKLIGEMSEMIEDEIEGANEYIMKAYELRESNPTLSKLFCTLANEELTRVDRLHGAVVTIITDYRNANGEPPAPMMAVYDYLHKKHIDKAAKVRALVNTYK